MQGKPTTEEEQKELLVAQRTNVRIREREAEEWLARIDGSVVKAAARIEEKKKSKQLRGELLKGIYKVSYDHSRWADRQPAAIILNLPVIC